MEHARRAKQEGVVRNSRLCYLVCSVLALSTGSGYTEVMQKYQKITMKDE